MHSPASAARFQLNHFRAGSTPSVRSVKPSSRARMGIRAGPWPRGCLSRSSSPRACEQPQLCLSASPPAHSGTAGAIPAPCTPGSWDQRPWTRPPGPQPGSAQDTPWPCDTRGTSGAQGAPAPEANPGSITRCGCAGTAPALPCCHAELNRALKPNLTPALDDPKGLFQPKPPPELPELR